MSTATICATVTFFSATAFSAVGRGNAECFSGIQVQPTYLYPQRTSQPSNQVFALTSCSSITDLPSCTNFLATQVWPSARVAAMAIERYIQQSTPTNLVVCEFGCGPGLPSLAAAHAGAANVFATDIDGTALALVNEASKRQGLSHKLETMHYDLINSYMDDIPHADVYLFSDVFESSQVAEGAARVAAELLRRGRSKVWVFAQSDRSQRDVFLRHLRDLVQDESLVWSETNAKSLVDNGSPLELPLQCFDSLWLSEIDETAVPYG